MTFQERNGALWALQTMASSRYTLEITKVAMYVHDNPRVTLDSIKTIFWPDEEQFRNRVLPKSLIKRYAGLTQFAGMTWDSWQDVIINDARVLLNALDDDDFIKVRVIMRRNRISQSYHKSSPN